MAKAYYPSGSSFKEWTPEMVNAFGLDGDQYKVQLTHATANATGWRQISSVTVSNTWASYREVYLVSSRHSGTGLLAFSFSTNGALEDYEWSMNLTGVGSALDSNTLYSDCKFLLAYGTDHVLRLFCGLRDYNTVTLTRLTKFAGQVMSTPTNGTWTTTSPKTTYSGRYLEAEYNAPSVIVSSSQPSTKTTSAVLWIEP